MKKSVLFYCAAAIIYAADLDYNIGLTSNYGDSYDFYSFSENRLNMNFFYNNLQAWLQYEYSNPPELGNSMNKLRKVRLEYEYGDWLIKFGDIYEIWGRGLILNQLDDQIIDFDKILILEVLLVCMAFLSHNFKNKIIIKVLDSFI